MATIWAAPAERSTAAAVKSDAPLVITSSTSITCLPLRIFARSGSTANASLTLSSRAWRLSSVCGCVFLTRNSNAWSSWPQVADCLASSAASSQAWLKPRVCKRSFESGNGKIRSSAFSSASARRAWGTWSKSCAKNRAQPGWFANLYCAISADHG